MMLQMVDLPPEKVEQRARTGLKAEPARSRCLEGVCLAIARCGAGGSLAIWLRSQELKRGRWLVHRANENERSDSRSTAGTAEVEDPPATCRHDPIVETPGECHRSYSYIYKFYYPSERLATPAVLK